MRIGMIVNHDVFNIAYRALRPAEALRKRGHEVEVVVQQPDGTLDPRPLHHCDVVHVYRRADVVVRHHTDQLRARGIALTWDNDDDLRRAPPASKRRVGYSSYGAERDFVLQMMMLRRADVVTTTSEMLAEVYRRAGAACVRPIENYLGSEQYSRAIRLHEGLVIGWVAGHEHEADANALGIHDVLRRVMARHDRVQVVSVGLALRDLDEGRYFRHRLVPHAELHNVLRGLDIGIAPIADIPMSYLRSNVKVKEYAAVGTPWIASNRGPYVGLGERQGGLLVDDGEWEQALDRLIRSRMLRLRLRRRAAAWARTQSIDRHADQWISVFDEAIRRARERAGAPHTSRSSTVRR